MQNVLRRYGIDPDKCHCQPLGNGLINSTWLLQTSKGDYVLQKINHQIFKAPLDIAYNMERLAEHLQAQHPQYLFVSAVKDISGETMIREGDDYYRLLPFVKDSHTIDVVSNPDQAYEAARQFGRFTKMLAGFDAADLRITLPHFHDLPLRYQQFEKALQNGNKERLATATGLVAYLQSQETIVNEFLHVKDAFKQRVTHHDTKISNVLFDKEDRGLCVIDLDTVMPGFFISDVGDMIRTYLCPVSEEEADLSKILIRPAFYKAILDGYCSEMGDELNKIEKEHFLFAGKFMIYMQALRFLTDYLNNDVYYGSRYEGHNFIRAQNQARLLQELIAFENDQGCKTP